MEKKTVWLVEVEWLVSKHFAVSAPADMSKDDLKDLLQSHEPTLRGFSVFTPEPWPLDAERGTYSYKTSTWSGPFDPEKSVMVQQLMSQGYYRDSCSITVEKHGTHHG